MTSTPSKPVTDISMNSRRLTERMSQYTPRPCPAYYMDSSDSSDGSASPQTIAHLEWIDNYKSTAGNAINGGMDDFRKLPAELHVRVMMLLADLSTLQHLIYTSPILNAAFEQNHVRIVNIILSGLTLELRQAMRAVAIALTECPDTPLIDGDLFDNRGDPDQDEFRDVDEKFGTPTLPSTFPLSACRQLLLISCRIQRVSTHYFKKQIDRLNSIESEHLLEEEYEFDLRDPEPFKERPPGVAYTPRKTGPASWIERYRVECSLWRLQLLAMFSLHGTVHPAADHSLSQEKAIMTQDFMRLWHGLTLWERDQMVALQEYMDEEFISIRWPLLEGLEREFRHPDKELACVPMSHPPLDIIPTDELTRAWGQDRATARQTSLSHCYFGYDRQRPRDPVRGATWATFRRLGFGFWDFRRMCEMELMTSQDPELVVPKGQTPRGDVGIPITYHNCFFTWISIKLDGKRVVSHNRSVNGSSIW